MKKSRLIFLCSLFLLQVVLAQGCGKQVPPYNYGPYLEHMPRSILVLPPCNESTEVMAPYIYLSTVTRPLAERGYYVFPVAMIDMLMKENGFPSPEDMAQVPLDKIREIIDPDAVLYLTIKNWGTKYRVLDSATTIHVWGKLVDTDTGNILWQGERTVVRSSSENQNGIIQMLVAAILNQIISSFADPSRDIARITNGRLFLDPENGLLLGQRHSEYEEDQRLWRQRMNQSIAENGGG